MGTRAEIRHPPKRNPKTQTTAQRKDTASNKQSLSIYMHEALLSK